MTRPSWKDWTIVSYVLDHYEGVEWVEGPTGVPRPVRRFMWADDTGEVWIGNVAAFAEHMAERFGYDLLPYDYVNMNTILIDVGERIHEPTTRQATGEKAGQQPLQPKKERA